MKSVQIVKMQSKFVILNLIKPWSNIACFLVRGSGQVQSTRWSNLKAYFEGKI